MEESRQQHHPAASDVMELLSKANHDLSLVQRHLEHEFQRDYHVNENPSKIFARIKNIQEEVLSLKELCRELLTEKQIGMENLDSQVNSSQLVVKKGLHGKKGTPNKRFPKSHSTFVVEALVHQVKLGRKVDKSFKRSAWVAAANALNETFRENYTPNNVENHMRTVKKKYMIIKKCREISGAGWDEEQKIITLNGQTYKSYVEAHPEAEPYLNKPIDQYDSLHQVCGDDQTTSYFGKALYEDFGSEDPLKDTINLDAEIFGSRLEVDTDTVESTPPSGGQISPRLGASSTTKYIISSGKDERGKRKRQDVQDDMMMVLVNKVGEVASALNSSTTTHRTTHWIGDLYKAVMEVEGYEETALDYVFDQLAKDEITARVFMVKSVDRRRIIVEKYIGDIN